ncbi:MAG: TrkA C-terminal domain-containing protein [Phycisphaerales bacterium]|nr:MAG: TrkA C-terminal domain-containing protein [Phycisphaerales bacterium]
MSWMLFIIVIIVSFIVVRIGAIAFQLTGLEWSLAKFQSLSCFPGTGFTTQEAELITGHRQRRKIASVLMVLGNAGFVVMIATFANSLRPQQILEKKLIDWLFPFSVPSYLLPWINLLIIIVAVLIISVIFRNQRVRRRFTNFLRKRIIRRELFTAASFEELLLATGGYGVSKIDICAGSPVLNKTLSESQLKHHDVIVLAITRAERTMPNPPADTKIALGDQLICFGKLQNIRDRTCMNP